MNKDKYVFAQLVEFLDSFKFRRIVAKYNGDRYVKHLTCWNQFLAMMFGQLANRESLRDLIVALDAHLSKCYHLGLGKNISKSSLSRANQDRDYIIFEEFGFLDNNKQKVDFLAYFRAKARERYEKWDCVCNHFEKFCGGKCTFGDITVELCEKFRDYLLKCKQIHHPNSYISRNSAAGYYSTFRALLKIAYKEKMLRENLNDFLEKIEWKEVKKEYLTLDEVKLLAATPCRISVPKQASLFACMTGLRISDILKLQWSDFEMGPDQGYYIRICTEKTETEATLPISHEALELCGKWGKGLVFKGLTRALTHHPLKQWIAEAGIKKKITFHCLSHSISSFSLKTNDLQNLNL